MSEQLVKTVSHHALLVTCTSTGRFPTTSERSRRCINLQPQSLLQPHSSPNCKASRSCSNGQSLGQPTGCAKSLCSSYTIPDASCWGGKHIFFPLEVEVEQAVVEGLCCGSWNIQAHPEGEISLLLLPARQGGGKRMVESVDWGDELRCIRKNTKSYVNCAPPTAPQQIWISMA